jgi:hypothetical protein
VGLLEAIVIAVVIAIIVGAVLTALLGPAIKSIPAPIAGIVGDFFIQWGWAIGVLAGLLFFFTNSSVFGLGKH